MKTGKNIDPTNGWRHTSLHPLSDTQILEQHFLPFSAASQDKILAGKLIYSHCVVIFYVINILGLGPPPLKQVPQGK